MKTCKSALILREEKGQIKTFATAQVNITATAPQKEVIQGENSAFFLSSLNVTDKGNTDETQKERTTALESGRQSQKDSL